MSVAISTCRRMMLALATSALMLAGAAMVTSARAQVAAGDQVGSLDANSQYDDHTVRRFAQAAASVLALRGSYYPRVKAAQIAGSKDKADRLFNEMRRLMREAVHDAGLTEESYRAIAEASKTDQRLYKRINDLLREPPPARRNVEAVKPVTPTAPKAPAAVSPEPAPAATATPAKTTSATPAAAPANQQQLSNELDQAIGERDRYRAEQQALHDKVAALEQQLASAKEQDSAQRAQLITEKEQAEAKQKQTQRKLARLHGEVAGLKDQLASAQSHDADLRDQLDAERARAEEAQRSKEAKLAAFQSEVERLAGRLAKARHALDALADNLSPAGPVPGAPTAPPFEALTPLKREPTSIERVMANADPQFALRQELSDELARTQKERKRREAERAALQKEIAELSRELTATYQAMAELTGQPTGRARTAATSDMDNESDAPLDLSDTTAQLFPATPAGDGEARLDASADLVRDDAGVVDGGDPVIESSPAEPSGSVALDAHTVAAIRVNPAPAPEIATAPVAAPSEADTAADAPRAPHQIARDEDQGVQGASSSQYSASVRGGALAYRAGDYRDAYEIWAALAESGNRSAQFHLGALYFEGRGTSANITLSHFWLQVSALQGDDRAVALLAVVASKMTQSQIDTSRREAREWLRRHPTEVTQAEPASGKRL